MRSLDLNLASRPFENNVPFWTGHALLLAVVLGFAAWNVQTYMATRHAIQSIQADIGSSARQMAELDHRDDEAVKVARGYDLKTLQTQADVANEIILRRGLSWTNLFNQLEKVMPYEVRATAVRPLYGTGSPGPGKGKFEGTVPISLEGVAQSFEAFLEFERALIMDPHYSSVEPFRTETVTAGNTELKFELTFLYDPLGRQGEDHPNLPHVLDAARKAEEEGGEAPPDAMQAKP